ncbi:MAG: ribonucleoside reductase class II, partial [Omnitrophica bacterium RBG_13_46_9]
EQYTNGGINIFTDDRILEILYNKEENGNVMTQVKTGLSLNPISKAFKTGVRAVLKLVTESGLELIATPDHKIMTTEGWVEMKDLESNEHKILIQPAEGKFNEDGRLPSGVCDYHRGDNGITYKFNFPRRWSKELGRALGWLVGDGWLIEDGKNCRVGFAFSKDDKEILDYLKPIINDFYGFDVKEILRENGVYHLSYHSKYFVEFFKNLGIKAWNADEKEPPVSIFTAPKEAVIGFLQGLFTADGTIRDNPKSNSSWIALTSKSKKLLNGVQLLLLNLGIKSRIYDRSREPREDVFSYVAKNGELKTYACDGKLFELGIFSESRERFKLLIGFLNEMKKKRLEDIKFERFYKQTYAEKVISVETLGKEEVYDLTEPNSHSMIVNGIVTHQCGEQPLLPYESCNLGSINLSLMVDENNKEIDWDKLAGTVRVAIHFLDNVIDMNCYPLERIKEMTKANRKVGLGVMGFADMLIKLGIKYDSEEAVAIAEKIMKFIQEKAIEASRRLAEKRRAFTNFGKSIYAKERPLRNATLTTIAPTGSISIIAGCSSGIEPLFALSYVRKILDNERLVEVYPYFEKLAKEQGFYSPELMKRIAEAGSIKNMEEIPRHIRELFVTSFDISPSWHIRMQAAFQRHTHNAVSKTVNFPHESTEEDIKEVYMLAFKTGCKGVTVYRDRSREEQVLNIDNKAESKETSSKIIPRPRPNVTHGTTTKIATGCGNLYVTINEDEEDLPFEVFMQMGKAGGCAMSQLEAIGRLLSLALRSGIDIDSIIEQLRGIRCPSPSWEKGGRIFSCSDAIARVIERRLVIMKKDQRPEKDISATNASDLGGERAEDTNTNTQNSNTTLTAKHKIGNIVGVCPDCGGALWHVEGCMVCKACGYSKCG